MKTFAELWDFVSRRGVCIVQEQSELEPVFNLIKGCDSYLEVGTAEGNSLYVLAHALNPGARITCIDLGEKHCIPHHNEIIKLISGDYSVAMYHGNSRDEDTYPIRRDHDVVFIDGGHDYETVKSDCAMYAGLARKYLIFHDIALSGVKNAVSEFLLTYPHKKYSEIVHTETMGMGIVEL